MASYIYFRKPIERQFQHVDCVKWAADGRIAVLTADQVVILEYPSNPIYKTYFFCYQALMSKDQGIIPIGAVDAEDVFAPGLYPYLLEHSSSAEDNPMQMLHMDWSRPGLAWDGGCLLAVVMSNGGIEILEPPVHALEFEWVSVASPSDVLLQHLQAVEFDISRPAEAAKASSKKGKRAQGKGRLKQEEWLARRFMVASQCVAWAPCVWASPSGASRCSLLAVGSRGLLGLFVWGLGEGGAQGRLRDEPAVILPAKEVSCLAWHVEEGEDVSMQGEGEGEGEVVGPAVLLAYGTSEGVAQLFRVTCRWHSEGLWWDLVPLAELCRPSVRRVQCLAFGRGVGELGDVLVAAMGPMLTLWQLNGDAAVKVQAEPEAHEDTVVSLDWGWGVDGQGPLLVSGGLEGTFKVWEAKAGPGGPRLNSSTLLQPPLRAGSHLLGLSLSPNHQVLASVRSVPEEFENSSNRQLLYTRRISRGVLFVCPTFQSNSRSVHVPPTLHAFATSAQWPSPGVLAKRNWLTRSLGDILTLAYLDTSAMVELQFDPNFFKPPIPHDGEQAEGLDVHELDPSTGLPRYSLAVRNSSAAHRLCAYTESLQPTDLLAGGEEGAQALLAWRLMHAIHAHLLVRLFEPQLQQAPESKRAMAVASEHILATHVHASLTRLLTWVDTDGAEGLLLPPYDARAALNMAAWVQGRLARLEEKVPTSAAQVGWAKLAGRVTAACTAAAEDVCFLCGGPVQWVDEPGAPNEAQCGEGHVLSRCMETLLIIDSIDYWECRCCMRKARPHQAPPPGARGEGTEDGSAAAEGPVWRRPPWLAEDGRGTQPEAGVWCLFCQIPCLLVNR